MVKLRHLLPLAAVLAAGALHAAPALASGSQETILQDDTALKANSVQAFETLRSLGVTRVRVTLMWDSIAPAAGSSRKPRFDASDPGAYGTGWAYYDVIDTIARQQGISVYFVLTGPAPLWATGPGAPADGGGRWLPSAREFGAFVHAAGERYGGAFRPSPNAAALPRVSFWSIWNEPNYGYDLAPAATARGTVETDAAEYRGLVDAAWGSLLATGHRPGRDTVLIGETAPRGVDPPGVFNGVKPLRFLRALYCVDSRFRPLRGRSATLRGCPTTSAGSRAFRRSHPGLFDASGFADHPYALQANPGPPTVPTTQTGGAGRDSDFADLPQLGALTGTLDRLNRVYGSRTRFPIWNTEFGYRTHPPDPNVRTSQATAAFYMNWAEYLSWRNPRLNSYMQYLLTDPPSGKFASGLLQIDGRAKATLTAFRMPLFLPSAAAGRGRTLEVWGAARPAAQIPGTQWADIEFHGTGRGSWVRIARVRLSPRGYFDVRERFPSSGTVRTGWRGPHGEAYYSRYVTISVR